MESQPIMNTIQVLKTRPLNDLLTEAIAKVCEVSDEPNRNKTVINREVGQEIAATLPGAPVAGLFDKDSGDFVQHSTRVSFRNGEIDIEDLTKAYGFVDPTVAPWYQDFDEDGVVKTYLVCKIYLWTRQYEEASLAIGKGQSMELNENEICGYYSGDVFIFTSATTDKLCILGDDYAPCFSGAKILSNFCAQYESIQEELEKTLGRRYYVMDGKLQTYPETPISLNYALQLGWNLTDAIYHQLGNRGAEVMYEIQGIYADGSAIFTILQDRTSLEYVRCEVIITGEDTVVLGSDMVRVKQEWAIQAPAPAAPIEPVADSPRPQPTDNATTPSPIPQRYSSEEPVEGANGNTGVATDSTLPAQTENPVVDTQPDTTLEPSANFTEGGEDQTVGVDKPMTEPTTDFSQEPEGTVDPVVEPTTEPTAPVTEPIVEPTAEFADKTKDEGEDKDKDKEKGTSGDDGDSTKKDEDDEETKKKYAAMYADELAAKDARITELEARVASYAAAEEATNKIKKDEMIASYSDVLSAEEKADITKDLGKYSLEEVESKCAIAFARKARSGTSQFQLNLSNTTPADAGDAELPAFMLQAMEIDKASELSI